MTRVTRTAIPGGARRFNHRLRCPRCGWQVASFASTCERCGEALGGNVHVRREEWRAEQPEGVRFVRAVECPMGMLAATTDHERIMDALNECTGRCASEDRDACAARRYLIDRFDRLLVEDSLLEERDEPTVGWRLQEETCRD